MPASAVDSVIYDISVAELPRYRGRKVILRADSAGAVVNACRTTTDADIVCVQLQGLRGDADVLGGWGHGIPVQLTMDDPRTQFPALYRYGGLVRTHPVRVTMPVRPGFSRAVRLATALRMAVKLEVGQPAPAAVEELVHVLDLYLHEPSCRQPIEPFHGALGALYRGATTTVWDIQEENPAYVRRVDHDGSEGLIRRDLVGPLDGDLATLVERWGRVLRDGAGECRTCEAWATCGGYFKWPRRDYECTGVRALFRTLVAAAAELRQDVARADLAVGGRSS
jgi:hypothetical protein